MKPLSQQRHKARRAGNKIFMYDPSSKDKSKFKDNCSEFAPKYPLDGAISVSMIFSMPRPKSHYRSGKYSHILKDSAPALPISKPDIDNLIKFYLDAMTGSFWKDDAYICTIEASKIYSDDGQVEIEYWNSPE
jgi:Holliday junction resolvase RusA-like endonuclease|tara:strand:- start:1345 stop:1743 length:399 start_codon:yes stop_codon:yes gene_type:complete